MLKIKHITAVVLVLLTLSVHAYDGWSTGQIDKIRIQSMRVLINQNGASNPGNCSNIDYLYLEQGDSIYHKNMYAALLTAYANKSEVSLALKGCSNGGNEGYPVISEVWIK